jgi:tryptophanyl-tRNA synthetase
VTIYKLSPNLTSVHLACIFGVRFGKGITYRRIPEVSLRVLSGIQPSGRLHIGNYFGAMRQHLQLQKENDGFYFIADYHALTSNPEPADLGPRSLDVAIDYLALGLDPGKTVFWRQSDVPEVTELTWLLSCTTPMGLLQRCVSYKDKVAQGLSPNHGLFAYPVLQAADILLYDSELVPVGADQKQHIEVTRDIATRFNNAFGQTFTVPEPYILDDVAVVPGIDGRKMSKSYDNTIEIFEPESSVRKKVMRIVTDSTGVEEPKNPDDCNIFALMKLVAEKNELAEWRQRYRTGPMGYGEAKKRLAQLLLEHFEPFRKKRAQLEKSPDYIRQVLADGAARARVVAVETVARARKAMGLKPSMERS